MKSDGFNIGSGQFKGKAGVLYILCCRKRKARLQPSYINTLIVIPSIIIKEVIGVLLNDFVASTIPDKF